MNIEKILLQHRNKFSNILPFNFKNDKFFEFDFSVNNKELYNINLTNVEQLSNYVQQKIKQHNANFGIGGYAENRLIYKRSKHFGTGDNARSIHLGIDIWCNQKTPIFAFMDSKIHSFNNNQNFGDYGPTIILKHKLENTQFYTLYGHLTKNSIKNIKVNQKIKKGDKFAEIGNSSENGNWPPHLHFQIITDMLGKKGDFFGVCSFSEKEKFLEICPNPNLILNYG